MLERHYHPSVRNFATSLMNENKNNKIVYTGDPLLDFSTSAFLERFSYRNPKQKDLQSIKRESGRGKYSKRRSGTRMEHCSYRHSNFFDLITL